MSKVQAKKSNLKDKFLGQIYWIIPPFILAIFTFLLYLPSRKYPFQFDDIANIVNYYHVRVSTIKNLFFGGPRWISYWINTVHYHLYRFDPLGYHMLNIIVHIATGIVIFYLFYSLLNNLKNKNFFQENALYIAFTTSGLFLLHPVQTQTISYIIQGQLEGFSTSFITAIVFIFYKQTQAKNKPFKWIYTVLLFVFGFFSCGSKETAILSPILLLIVDWFFIAQGSFKDLKKRLLLHGIFSAMIFGIFLKFLKPKFFTSVAKLEKVTHNNFGNVINQNFNTPIKAVPYCFSQFKVILHYIWIFLWPVGISAEYDWKMVDGFMSPDCFLPFLVLVAIGILVYKLLRKNSINPITFGIIWFFIGILPRSSIIPSSELVSDYKTYLSSVGIFFLLAIGIVKIITLYIKNNPKKNKLLQNPHGVLGLIFIFMIPIGLSMYNRNLVWSDEIKFWENIIKNAPEKARAYGNLGMFLCQKEEKYKEAIPLFKKAIQLDPSYPDPHNNISICYATFGKYNLAINHLRSSIRINPKSDKAYNNLGNFLIKVGKLDQAEEALLKALSLNPHYGKAFMTLGNLYMEKKNYDKALEYLKKSFTIGDGDNEIGYSLYGAACFEAGHLDESEFAYKKTLQLEPNNREALLSLGNIAAKKGNAKASIAYFQQHAKLYPHVAVKTPNLAEAYFKDGQFEKALRLFEKLSETQRTTYVFTRIALCLGKLGQKNDAKRLLQKLNHKLKNNAKAQRLIGEAWREL